MSTTRRKGLKGVDVDVEERWHSFFSLLLRPRAFASSTRRIDARPYLAEVAEQHALPVGGSRRFHGF